MSSAQLRANLKSIDDGVELWVHRLRTLPTDMFRELVWTTFRRILHETPQYTGKAVANWNIGVGSPDPSVNLKFGDAPDERWYKGYRDNSRVELSPVHSKGDYRWIRTALDRNRHKIKLIRWNTPVYITNYVYADDDSNGAARFYLQDLQDPGVWSDVLREVNKPYETAAESIIIVAEAWKIANNGRSGMKIGGPSLAASGDYEYGDVYK